jgi:hypothetical protein
MQTLATKRSVYSVSLIDSTYTDSPGGGTKLLQMYVKYQTKSCKITEYLNIYRTNKLLSGNPMAVSMLVNATYRNVPEPFHFKLTIS